MPLWDFSGRHVTPSSQAGLQDMTCFITRLIRFSFRLFQPHFLCFRGGPCYFCMDSCHHLLTPPAGLPALPADHSVFLLCRHSYYHIFIFKTSVLKNSPIWGHSSPWSPFVILPIRMRRCLLFAQSPFGLELSTVL